MYQKIFKASTLESEIFVNTEEGRVIIYVYYKTQYYKDTNISASMFRFNEILTKNPQIF